MDSRPNRRNEALYSSRISVGGRFNRINKAVFSCRSSHLWVVGLTV